MTKKIAVFVLISLVFLRSLSQTDSVNQLLASIEASSSHEESLVRLYKLFNVSGLSKDDKLAIQTAIVLKYQELKKWDSCLAICQREISIAYQQNNTLSEASFYKLLGNTYYHISDKDKAVQYWQKCIDIAKVNKHSILLEQGYHNIAAVYIDFAKHYDIAEDYLLKSLELARQNKKEGTSLFNQHYRLLATLYERTNQLKKAASLYLEVIESSKALKDTLRLTEALMFYSDVLVKENKIQQAIEVSAQALELSQKVRLLDLKETALNFHAKNLSLAGRYKEAYSLKEQESINIRNRFLSDLNTKMSEAEARFKNAEAGHEKELAIVNAKKEKQLLILLAVGAFVLAGFIIYYLLQKRHVRQKHIIQQQVQEEKERLSRDLHDNLGSQMALLSNTIESLDAHRKKELSIDESIQKLKNNSRQLLTTLRETIWILDKKQVAVQEFFDKLVDYTHRYLQSFPGMNLQVEEEFVAERLLQSNEALQLFRICQEAISNACKYSGSDRLVLKGNCDKKGFTIVIADRGSGFKEEAIQSSDHYGLSNMKERAHIIGAKLEIKSVVSEGVQISVAVA